MSAGEVVVDDEGYVVRSFLDMSPLRRPQSPFIDNPNTKELPAIPRRPKPLYFYSFSPSTPSPTVNYIKRISFFVLLELGFIILAALSLRKPIFLGSSGDLDDAKGGFTVFFILWQTVAIFPLQHIILSTLSHEWSIQWSHTPTPLVDSRRIDQVSVLTSTILDRFRFLLRGDSSTNFKLAFGTSLALLSLATLGPGSVGVTIVRRDALVDVNVGKLALTRPESGSTSFSLQRAQMVTHLEQLGNSPYGFNIQPNYVVGWPLREMRSGGIDVSYPSDIVKFRYTCRWEAPSLSGERNTVIAGGGKWLLGQGPGVPVSRDGGVTPVVPIDDTPLSAFLFYGSNDTYQAANNSRYVFNLGNTPALFNLTGIRDPQFSLEIDSPLLSILICDPHLEITGGRVILRPNGALSVEANGPASIGNIPQSAANFLFAHGLSMATQLPDVATRQSPIFANLISARMFLDQPNLTNLTAVNKPLNLDDIGKNMDTFVLSASKAFADGYSPNNADATVGDTFATIPVKGTMQEEVMALTATEALLILTIILSVSVVILATALCMKAPESLELFNLETISQRIERSSTPRPL